MCKKFSPLLNNLDFLEFYGRMLGDGWLSVYVCYDKGKRREKWIIGFSGHLEKDRVLMEDTIKKSKNLFDRNGHLKEKLKYNALELWIGHRELVKFINQELGFPIGKKVNLKISEKINKKPRFLIPIIRGIFDTDGSFFLDKNFGRIYPQIEIHMNAILLLDQLELFLKSRGFRLTRRPQRIRLKGIKQITKWMNEIGSSNPKHILRYLDWLKKCGPVAQLG
jgi:hypothetical protein